MVLLLVLVERSEGGFMGLILMLLLRLVGVEGLRGGGGKGLHESGNQSK